MVNFVLTCSKSSVSVCFPDTMSAARPLKQTRLFLLLLCVVLCAALPSFVALWPLPPSLLFPFPPILPSLTHCVSSIQGDASPSHPAPFNSVHCVHFIPAPIPRIFRILGETLRILRTQCAETFAEPKAKGVSFRSRVVRGFPGAVEPRLRGKVWELIQKEAYESR